MGTPFTSKINGNDIYAKRAEATRSGVNLETFTPKGGTEKKGILPAGLTPGNEGKDAANTLATQKYVLDRVGEVDALSYKGVVDTTHPLPTEGYKTGWTYKVAEAGTYAGHKCEIGDMLIANKDYAGTAANADWDAIEHNIDGVVIGPDTAVDADLAVFDSTTGKAIRDSSVSLSDVNDAIAAAATAIQSVKLAGASDPLSPDASNQVVIPNAVATGAQGETNGLMSAADKAKLDGIAQAVAGSNTPGMVTFATEDL